MTRPRTARALVATTTLVLVAIASGAARQEEPSSRGRIKATIPPDVVTAAEKIANDPQVLGLVKDQSTDAAAKAKLQATADAAKAGLASTDLAAAQKAAQATADAL